jgi:predicted nucleotidyltransferase
VFDAAALLRQLAQHRVEYVVVGGLAMVTQGSAHVTEDLDVCYSRTSANIAALASALAPLHPYLRGVPEGLPFRLDAATIQAGLNFTLVTDSGPIDLLGEIAGLGSYPQVFAHAEEHTVFDLTVRVLSLEGLILAKKAAGRKKDLLHLQELEELRKLRESSP